MRWLRTQRPWNPNVIVKLKEKRQMTNLHYSNCSGAIWETGFRLNWSKVSALLVLVFEWLSDVGSIYIQRDLLTLLKGLHCHESFKFVAVRFKWKWMSRYIWIGIESFTFDLDSFYLDIFATPAYLQPAYQANKWMWLLYWGFKKSFPLLLTFERD